jgi:hypothetical protein
MAARSTQRSQSPSLPSAEPGRCGRLEVTQSQHGPPGCSNASAPASAFWERLVRRPSPLAALQALAAAAARLSRQDSALTPKRIDSLLQLARPDRQAGRGCWLDVIQAQHGQWAAEPAYWKWSEASIAGARRSARHVRKTWSRAGRAQNFRVTQAGRAGRDVGRCTIVLLVLGTVELQGRHIHHDIHIHIHIHIHIQHHANIS